MRAAILAGGLGTRLGALFPNLPKPMVPVMGKPLLQHQVEGLVAQGIRDITLITGYKAEVIQAHFGDGERFGARIGYILEDEPLGTGGALCMLPREDTLVLMGDVYTDMEFSRFIRFHQEHRADVSLFAHPNSHPHDSDILVTDGDMRVTAWVSKHDANKDDYRNLVNAGLYLFAGMALPKGKPERCDLDRDCVSPLVQQGRVFAFRSSEYVKDMGTPERLVSVERDMVNGIASARSLQRKQRAVFIDRDGTLNQKAGFIRKPNELLLLDGAAEALRFLNASPFLAICITNQPVIARGEVTPEGLEAIHARLDTLLGKEGAYLDDLFYCPHHPDKGFPRERIAYKTDCHCRKPKPGLLLAAAERYHIDLAGSYMVGDSTADIAAGKDVGCVAYGVRTGEALADGKYAVKPDGIYDTLQEAVKAILRTEDTV